MNSPKLKPCPHCGGKDLIIEYNSVYEQHHVYCYGCRMCGPEIEGREKAAALWNALPRHRDISPNKVDCAGCPERQYRQGLVWTKEEPMHEGWYWWKCAGIIGIDFVREGGKRVLNDKTALWAGPIPLPQEATR